MTVTALVLFLASAGILYYVYHGYLVVLRLLALRYRAIEPPPIADAALPSVTMLVTVHDEERKIGACLENLFSLDYPRDKLEVIVASDGSTDRTNAIVAARARSGGVRLMTFDRIGKSAAQNAAIAAAKCQIVALADAESEFAKDYLRCLVAPFADERVGCVTAHLEMRRGAGAVAEGQSWYWRYELRLRELESRLGILAVASGSAMAFRRSAFRPLPHDVGEDCLIPLDCAVQSLRVHHARNAFAWDAMNDEDAREFRARVRMTLRNWVGTWRRAALLNPLRHPGYAFALWSHKILRWLGPLFLLVMTLSSLFLLREPGLATLPAAMAAFYLLALVGGLAQARGTSVPVAGMVYSFCLANLGFLVGLAAAAKRQSIVSYPSGGQPRSRAR